MFEPLLPQHIDSTMLSCFRSCPQRFYTEFVQGARPSKASVDLHFGGVFASVLERFHREVWENKLHRDTALAKAHGTFISEWGDFIPEKETAKTPDRLWAAIEDYARTYPPAMDHCQPQFVDGRLTSEFSFAIPLEPADTDLGNGPGIFPLHPVTKDPFIYTGRADMLGTYNKRPAIRDEKTAGRLEGNWAEKWDMRAQFQGYCWAAQQGGIDCDTVIVRGIIITKKDIRQVEAIKIYPRWVIDRWKEQLRRDLWRIVRCWNEGYWDWNLGEACTNYGNCSFMSLCTTPPDQRSSWLSNFVERRWNPLDHSNPLSQPQASAAASLATGGPVLPSGPENAV